ncbi:MAG: NADPH-dependent FMN reductase [Desulfobacteraceae bacterium 4572_130]|nr:MAG: NADPH-dependent FMN reductase [Desulfobacteraceae bacterium 4572_130]
MKIITLLGSARSKGNTATFLDWIEKELKSLGHEVESIYLNSKKINSCLGCFKCKEHTEKIGCIQNDDAIEILGKIINAELTIFASPLYFWGFSAQIKALIDRSFSLVTNYHQPNHASLIENKKQALLVTGGGAYENNAEPVFTAFDRIIKFYKGIKAGELFLDKCTTPQEMDTKIKDKAIKFARKIAG